ncbi:glutamic acid-rich protein [Sesamum indicum]|uniref:Glutamic acid-rich protein n=1 Tax=Sesamum indicum TaxID=4182 RepID=A0A6I9TF85_SESIN|nr:glutamic acid-rich protein [Sesamum indicum]
MNFFKSILLDDPDPPKPENPHEPGPSSPLKTPQEDRNPSDDAQDGDSDGWSFGGLIKTFTTRSESVIETYRKDLLEFGSGLKKETEVIREAASRAVKDLPASLEAGTSALDGVLKSTAEIISKETRQVFASDGEPDTPETNRSLNSGRYSWFETQLSGIQSDLNTFCEEPEDVEEYKKWKLRFELEDKRDEIEGLIGENGTLEGVYEKVVPSAVDHETFWCRYFYRVDKLKQQERVRANLVKRAISVDDDDDELSWDVDDEEEKDGKGDEAMSGLKVDGGGDKGVSDGSLNHVEKNDGLFDGKEQGNGNVHDGDKNNVIEFGTKSSGDVSSDEKEVKSDEVDLKSNEKVKSEESGKEKNDEHEKVKYEESIENKNDENEKVKSEESIEDKSNKDVGVEKGESGEKSGVPVMVNHQAKMEEELEWDEIEDIGSGDEGKITHGERPNRAELRKQLNAAEDDEDLSWDIEDDDEPVKT